MKSYTDLNQSKKLVEFLPLKSADNVIVSFGNKDDVKTVVMPFETYNTTNIIPFSDIREVIPCWSLAVLLRIIPMVSLEEYNGCWNCVSYNNETHAHVFCKMTDDPIDACYEMIIKLHELKML